MLIVQWNIRDLVSRLSVRYFLGPLQPKAVSARRYTRIPPHSGTVRIMILLLPRSYDDSYQSRGRWLPQTPRWTLSTAPKMAYAKGSRAGWPRPFTVSRPSQGVLKIICWGPEDDEDTVQVYVYRRGACRQPVN